MTHSSGHLAEESLQKIVDLYWRSNAYTSSLHGNFIKKIPNPFLVIMMTHTVYFLFHFISKSFLSFFSTDYFAHQQCTAEKTLFLSKMKFQKKSKKNWQICIIPKILCVGKFTFRTASNYSVKMIRGNSKSASISILAKKKEKHDQQNGILPFRMLKTLDSNLYMKQNLVKNKLRIRTSTSIIEYTKLQHTKWGECVSQSRTAVWTVPPTFRFDFLLQRRMKSWSKVLCQVYFE